MLINPWRRVRHLEQQLDEQRLLAAQYRHQLKNWMPGDTRVNILVDLVIDERHFIKSVFSQKAAGHDNPVTMVWPATENMPTIRMDVRTENR